MSNPLQQQVTALDCPTRLGWLKLVLLSSSLAITACQSTSTQKIVTQKISTSTATPARSTSHQSTASTTAYRPLAVKNAGIPGLTDFRWDLVSINSKNPQPFINRPYLFLQSAAKTISGSTGCNALTGNYQIAEPQALKIQALAGHMACEDALAQEAEIMDVLGRVTRYQLQQNMLYLYDQNGALLMTARAGQ